MVVVGAAVRGVHDEALPRPTSHGRPSCRAATATSRLSPARDRGAADTSGRARFEPSTQVLTSIEYLHHSPLTCDNLRSGIRHTFSWRDFMRVRAIQGTFCSFLDIATEYECPRIRLLQGHWLQESVQAASFGAQACLPVARSTSGAHCECQILR